MKKYYTSKVEGYYSDTEGDDFSESYQHAIQEINAKGGSIINIDTTRVATISYEGAVHSYVVYSIITYVVEE